MKNSLYSAILKQISNSLQDKAGSLTKNEIEKQVEQWKLIIPQMSVEMLRVTLNTPDLMEEDKNFKTQDWEYLERELEEKFVVRLERGIIIQGYKQRNKDLTWWTGKAKLKVDNYYTNNFMEYMIKDLTSDVLELIGQDTDIILNNLADPNGESFSVKGMVVGHVQSGKTANYSSLICKAADAGYKFIVVIAGAQNNLRNQTQKRLNQIFVGTGEKGVGSLANFIPSKQPISLTSEEHDFKTQMVSAHTTTNLHNTSNPVLIVIKKHTKTLDHLSEWLGENQIDKSILVIDDESDYGSINTQKEENPTTINKKIRDLLNRFNKSAYIAYTATPFANIFIDHEAHHNQYGEDLFPRDFIYALKAPGNYFGAEKIFGSDDEYICEVPDEEVAVVAEETISDGEKEVIIYNDDKFIIKHPIDYQVDCLPDSLKVAINHFLLNLGIRRLLNQTNKHNSMLIHISRFSDVHIQVKRLVDIYYDEVIKEIKMFGYLSDIRKSTSNYNNVNARNIKAMKETFDKELNHVKWTFEDVLRSFTELVSEKAVQIVEVHQKNKGLRFEYRDDEPTNAIVVGGVSLSRGFTLEGLSISYFLRTTIFYDTLMQMGRWFGYRFGYQDLCKIYTTRDIVDKFKEILDATEDLMVKLEMMRDDGLTPEDFGLSVKVHPGSLLQVTARNKLKNTSQLPISMDLNGSFKETVVIDAKPHIIEENNELTKSFIELLLNNHKIKMASLKKQHKIWRKVDSSVIKLYLDKFKFLSGDLLGLKSKMPILFVKKYLEQNAHTSWDVVLLSGDSERTFNLGEIVITRPYRTVEEVAGTYKFAKSQVAPSKVEKHVVDEDYQKEKASTMRIHLERPVLFIHPMELRDKDKKVITNATALSLSFNTKAAKPEPISLVINTVLKREIELGNFNYMDDDNYEE